MPEFPGYRKIWISTIGNPRLGPMYSRRDVAVSMAKILRWQNLLRGSEAEINEPVATKGLKPMVGVLYSVSTTGLYSKG